MTEVQSETTGMKSQYAAQLAADLERNAKEQERIGAEVVDLTEQLRALQHDQALLVSMQQALGGVSPAATGPDQESSDTAVASVPRQVVAEPKPAKQKKAAATKPKAKKTAAKAAESKAATAAAAPTLVELIRNHLGQQSAPRSAANIATALAEAHPDRTIKATVVRTTVEGLVAKGVAERVKRGASVFYTAAASQDELPTQPTSQQDPTAN
ncbi:BlaI/MecI/CopY family transcriptional regulator [Streptomyces sp. PSKA54]|uniref:BlaI/MecI/CopY family transcriptional regulator n=1 Tax=Streptomyces himalayensis subsp. aureolus TaxID=2758039 RepID=A0A7W2D7B3_9ACTN|nr:BlaI/MecI/CopY family transcriptional regulator [Streptomyces himalayensis]MBA4865989.1 BlaI/MecI/CopY family transcriptional regulator [Streptomyces himalayensis subsp. aureolus]